MAVDDTSEMCFSISAKDVAVVTKPVFAYCGPADWATVGLSPASSFRSYSHWRIEPVTFGGTKPPILGQGRGPMDRSPNPKVRERSGGRVLAEGQLAMGFGERFKLFSWGPWQSPGR